MRPDVKLRNYKISKLQNRSRGYILITLMLFITLLAMAAVAVLPEIVHQIQRDREEEMIHRAVGYSRAIRKYYRNSAAIRRALKNWKTPTSNAFCASATRTRSRAKTSS